MEGQNVPVQDPNLPLARTEEEYLKDLAKTSDLIFIGRVVSMGKQPAFWSGHSNSYQSVRYKIEKILKGKYETPDISVDHIVVYASSTAQPGETPHLSRSLFGDSARLIVSAQKMTNGEWKSLNEEYGALPATEDWLHKIEAALRAK